MKKILLASDLDGTLLFREKADGVSTVRFSQKDADAIRAFRKAGHYFALCTGRTPNSIQTILKMIPELEPDGLILASGGALYDVVQRHPIDIRKLDAHMIPGGAAAEFLRYFHGTEKYTVYWSTPEISFGLIDRNPTAEKTHPLKLVSLEDWCSRPVDVLSLGLTPFSRSLEDAHEAVHAIEKRWGAAMRPFRNIIYIDVSAAHVDKGSGLSRMARLLGGDYLCCAVGDAHNDVPMFVEAGKENSYLLSGAEKGLDLFVKRRVNSVAECIAELLDIHK